jgi:hypothetical protein
MRRTAHWSPVSFAAALLLAAGLIASASQSAGAPTSVSNLTNAGNGYEPPEYLYHAGFYSTTDVAASFVAGSSVFLTSVTLSMGSATYTDQPLIVQLVADSGGQPGGVLATLTGDPTPSGYPDPSPLYTYTAPPNVALAASTKYWIELSVSNSAGPASGQYTWYYTSTAAFTGDPGWTMGGLAFRLGGNGTYEDWHILTTPNQLFSVQTVVPEPASLALLAIGSSLTLLRRRR